MYTTVGGVDVTMSYFNTQKYIIKMCTKYRVQCENNHNTKLEYKRMNTVGVKDYTN